MRLLRGFTLAKHFFLKATTCAGLFVPQCLAMPAAPAAAVTVALPRTSLRRIGETEFVASVVGKVRPQKWKLPTLLLRFVESNGAQTVFTVTGDALAVFDRCELYKTYTMLISGTSVKRTTRNEKFGVPSELEVSIRFKGVVPVEVATPSTGLGMIYSFRDWNTFGQIPVGAVVDVVGEVVKPLHREVRGSVVRVVVTLANRNMQQDINVLGDDILRLQIEEGDVLAISGVRVEEYRDQMTLGLSLLPAIQRNPVLKNEDRVTLIEEDGPVRKALRTIKRAPIPIGEALELAERMLEDVKGDEGQTLQRQHECALEGKLSVLGADFFDVDPPIVKEELLLLPSVLSDESGQIQVKVWNRPCVELFGMDAKGMRGLWEKGYAATKEEQEGLLEDLNVNMDRRVSCMCSIQAFKLGRKPVWQVSVNALDIL